MVWVTVMAQIQSLAQELPYAKGAAKKSKQNKTKQTQLKTALEFSPWISGLSILLHWLRSVWREHERRGKLGGRDTEMRGKTDTEEDTDRHREQREVKQFRSDSLRQRSQT